MAQAITLAAEASAATQAGEHAASVVKLSQAVALRPDVPRILADLAAAHVANGQTAEALAVLERIGALGVSWPVAQADEFAPLRGTPEFDGVLRQLAANLRPRGAGEMAFALREVTGLIECIVWREKTGEFFFGDVNGRAVWVRNPSGAVRRLTPEGDGLPGVFALAIDEERGVLWAATAAVPAMQGYSREADVVAALAGIDLESGAVRSLHAVPVPPGGGAAPVFRAVALGPDGTVYLAASGTPAVWRFAPGDGRSALEPWLQDEELISPQGLAMDADGGVLLVADRAAGLVRIDLRHRTASAVAAPPETTLLGLRGLTPAADGSVFAVQNGLMPNRILRLVLDEGWRTVSDVAVLEAGHLAMVEPSLGCLGPGGEFHFVGNAGWSRFDGGDGTPTRPRSVPIFKTKPAAPVPARSPVTSPARR